MVIALFDADGTLYTGQFGRGLMQYSSEHGRSFFARRYYASVLPSYLSYKLKLGSREKMQYSLIANISGMLQGLDKEQVRAAFTWLLNDFLYPTLREDVIQRLKEHQAKGHKIIVVSGMTMECAELFRDLLGMDGAIGTYPEFKNGKYTGRTIPPAVSGDAKVTRINEFIESNKWEVDWSSSYAYGDSFTDHYMLSMVGNPVAVYPDKKLLALAKEKAWEVLGTPKETS